jgi:hypothetical protein
VNPEEEANILTLYELKIGEEMGNGNWENVALLLHFIGEYHGKHKIFDSSAFFNDSFDIWVNVFRGILERIRKSRGDDWKQVFQFVGYGCLCNNFLMNIIRPFTAIDERTQENIKIMIKSVTGFAFLALKRFDLDAAKELDQETRDMMHWTFDVIDRVSEKIKTVKDRRILMFVSAIEDSLRIPDFRYKRE